MFDNPVDWNNAQRTLEHWRALRDEAEKIGADDAVRELEAAITAGEATLAPYEAKAAEYASACAELKAARERTKEAARAFELGKNKLSAVNDVRAEEARYEAEVNRTRAACLAVTCDFARQARPLDEAVKEARALIGSLESACRVGSDQEWYLVHRVSSLLSAKFEPVFAARVDEKTYGEHAGPDAKPFAVLRDCLDARAKKPGGRMTTAIEARI